MPRGGLPCEVAGRPDGAAAGWIDRTAASTCICGYRCTRRRKRRTEKEKAGEEVDGEEVAGRVRGESKRRDRGG